MWRAHWSLSVTSVTVTDAPQVAGRAEGLLSPRHRVLTMSIVSLITLLAFDEMSFTAVMPIIARDLHGMHLYSWAFSATLIASLVATVAGGAWADAAGPARPMRVGLAAFLAGLLVAGFAPDMGVFIAGRTIQGLGAGAVITAIYVLIARAYPESMRPRVFVATSAAWVVPSLVGPTIAALVAEHLTWRAVFLGLTILVLPPVIMLRSTLRTAGSGTGVMPRSRLVAAIVVAAGAVVLLWGVGTLIPVAVAGLAVVGIVLPRLLPAGAFRLRRGLPSATITRGLLSAGFFGTEVFVPLGLISLHGFTATEAGAVLTVGALGWSGGSWVQGHSSLSRPALAVMGATLLTLGVTAVAAVMLATHGGAWPWLAAPAWVLSGAGMGLSLPAVNVIVMDASADHEQGANSSALQIADTLGAAVAAGLAGAIVDRASSLRGGITIAEILTVLIALAAVVAATRTRLRS
jgi:MFS family permease